MAGGVNEFEAVTSAELVEGRVQRHHHGDNLLGVERSVGICYEAYKLDGQASENRAWLPDAVSRRAAQDRTSRRNLHRNYLARVGLDHGPIAGERRKSGDRRSRGRACVG